MRPSRSSRALLALTVVATVGVTPGGVRAARAQRAATPQGGEFLLLPVGARATALGQAAVADGGTTEALFWNPAGLAALPRAEFAIHHYDAFFGTGDVVALALPSTRLGTLGIAAYLVNYGDLDLTRGDGGPEPVGRISPRNVLLAASYATEVVGGLAAGITYKLLQFRVDCSGDCRDVPSAAGTTQAVDVGVRYVMTSALPLVVGVSLRNVGFRLQVENRAQADPLPTRLVAGVSYEVIRPAAGLGQQGFDLRVLADVMGTVGRGAHAPVTLVGVESGVRDLIRLRGGYAFLDSNARGPSLGLGMRFGSVSLDLARVFFADEDLGEKEPIHFSFRVIF